jgi:aminoglycoside 2'-N-acetyltransferase I
MPATVGAQHGIRACHDARVAHVAMFREGATPDALRRQVRAMQEEAWPSSDPRDAAALGPWHDPELRPTSVLLVDGDVVLSALDLLFAHIEHSGRSWAAVGLSAVVTARALQGNGHARVLVTWVRNSLPDLQVDLGLFTCDRTLARFYSGCGWEPLPGTVLVGGTPDQPFASDRPEFDKVAFGAFATTEAIRARDAFTNTRILLHCGTVDSLW